MIDSHLSIDLNFNIMWPIIGQVLIIVGQIATLSFAVREIYKQPYTLWGIFVNKIRYTIKAGWRSLLPYNKEKPWYPENEGWIWFKKNPLYATCIVYFWSTIGIIFGLCHQLSLDQVFNKPKEFFVASPIRSVSLVYMFVFLTARVEELWKENTRLKRQVGLLKSQLQEYWK